MKKFKLITPVVASVSTLAIAASSIAAVSKVNNTTKPVTQVTNSSSVNAKDVISINVTDDEVAARQFMRYTAETVTWNGGTIDKSELVTIGNSAFAYSGLKSFTIPAKVKTIDPMAFYHTEDMETLDLSLVQDKMLESDFTIGTHAFQDMGDTKYGNGYVFKQLADASEANGSMEIYDLTTSYIKSMLFYAGATSGWMTNIQNKTTNIYDHPSMSYKAIPRQLMTFDTDGKLTGFKLSAISKNSSDYDTIIFPKFMKGMTDDGLTSFNAVKELGIVKNVGFISDTSSNDGIEIKADWFKGWDTLERVILPKNATVEEQTFSNCSNLSYVNLSQTNVTELPTRVFYNAGEKGNGLTLVLPTTLTTIKKNSLTGANVDTLDIPENVTTIESSACQDMSNLTYLNMNAKTTSINSYAFSGCSSLKEITYPDDSVLTNIGDNAFDGCKSLSTFKLPTSLGNNSNGTVGSNAFATSNSNKCSTIDLSNFSETQINNVTFSSECFTGWPSKGSVNVNTSWSTATQNAVMTKLYNAGLSSRWSKSTDVQKDNVLCAQYDAGTILTLNAGDFSSEEAPDVQYSYSGDAGTWTVLNKNTPITLDTSHNVLYLKGNNPTGFTKKSAGEGYTEIGVLSFTNSSATKGVKISGNILGLLDNGEKTITDIPTGATHCFDKLFYNATALQEVSSTFLSPATLTENCYQGMFYGCTHLTKAPTLSSTSLAKECYMNMFGESGIKTTPTLPATTLKEGCYQGMFQKCTSLVTANNLNIPNIVLADYCYKNMFLGCTNIQNPPKLPETDDTASTPVSALAKGCYYGMFSGCTKLSTAPEIKAYNFPEDSCREMFKNCTTLVDAPKIQIQSKSSTHTYGTGCFANMFENDTALKTMRVEFLSWPTVSNVLCTSEWAKGLSTGGTFYCPKNLPHASTNFNINQIPIDWNLVEEDDKTDPEKREDTYEDACATVDKKTSMILWTSANFKKLGKTTPELWYRIMNADGTWEIGTSNWTKYTKEVTIDAGKTIYLRCKTDQWGYKTDDTWSTAFASIVFQNPNGYSSGSTGVHIKGNVMSLVLKGLGINTETGEDDTANRKFVDSDGTSKLETQFCFYGLFMGAPSSDEQAMSVGGYSDSEDYKNHKYNYCIESIDDLFFSVPNLTYGIFGRVLCHCENLKNGPKFWSREDKGSRTTKRIAFGDTFKGCNSLTEPSDMNLDCIDSWEDGFWTFHGTYYNCASLTRAAELKITDISQLGGQGWSGTDQSKFDKNNCQTWQLCYNCCYNLKEVYWYTQTLPSTYYQAGNNNIYSCWLDKCGQNYFGGSKKNRPVIYMYDSYFTWLKKNCKSGYGAGDKTYNIPYSKDKPWVVRSITSGNILNTDKYSESDFED